MENHGNSAAANIAYLIRVEFNYIFNSAAIFNLPGLGRLTLRSVYEFDLSVVLATTILAATVVIVMNLIVDMLYAVLDPRVRLT